ncbi:MAG: hypothetical protein J5773_00240, partial [Verrucomicrobia bacterium]|nr:hypothetical protein [Verrucomicrobiota bacterium]
LEGLAGVILLRRFSFFKNTVWNVLKDVRRLRSHLQSERKRLASFRRRSDFWMVRHFLRARLNRWDEFLRIRRLGMPKVTGDTRSSS